MHEGFVKLWRKSKRSNVFAHEGLWKLWCLCLMKADHQPNLVTIEGVLKPVPVQPGQFITGRFSLHGDYHQWCRGYKKKSPSPYTLWRWLQTLQEMQNLSVESFNKYSVVTIVNWEQYQGETGCFTTMFHEKQATFANSEGLQPRLVQNPSIKNGDLKPEESSTYAEVENENEQQVSNRRATGEHRQECFKNVLRKESCGTLESLRALLVSTTVFCELPESTWNLVLCFVDKARGSNKTGSISTRRVQSILTDLVAVSGETSSECLDYALDCTIQRAEAGQFTFGKQNVTGYVKAVARSRHERNGKAEGEKYDPVKTDWDALYR
jgi:hypothetical protein